MNAVAFRVVTVMTLATLLLAVTAGCGGGTSSTSHHVSTPPLSSPPPGPLPVPDTVTISPTSDIVGLEGKRLFAANTPVTWRVQESSGGTIDTYGFYVAPALPGTYHVIATATADHSKTATATIEVAQSSFTLSGSLRKNRLGHTSTLLPDGKVLVAGGSLGNWFELVYDLFTVPEAELFDPSTGTSTIVGTVSRTFATATRLSDGRVLLTGGEYGWNGVAGSNSLIVAATAEIYDPAMGQFQPVSNMSEKREYHAATLLPDGRVLVTGGFNYWSTALSSAEIYDPTSGTFSSTGSMGTRRDSHTSTLLPNGKVLIAGGNDYYSTTGTSSAELYDPVTGTFSPTGSMAKGRAGHTATLLPSGNVLVAGGTGGATAELYDPSAGTFSPVGPMAIPRWSHTASLLHDGRVLIAGGVTNNLAFAYSAEIYDPATKSFVLAGTLTEARGGHTATTLANGDVLILGGSSDGILFTQVSHAELYK